MIPNEEKWHYLAFIKLSALLRGINSKRHADFYCLNYLHCFATKKDLELHEKICENKDFRNVIMPYEGIEILELNQYLKFDKAPFIIFSDLECKIEKIDRCRNNTENLSTTKVSEHIPSGFSMSKISLFRSINNEHDVYNEVTIA